MKYMLLIYDQEQDWQNLTDQQRGDAMTEYISLARDLRSAGKLIDGNELKPTSTATSVRIREDQQVITDGPFAETREQLGGYFLIEADNLDEAIGYAARIPAAKYGTVEIRPIGEG